MQAMRAEVKKDRHRNDRRNPAPGDWFLVELRLITVRRVIDGVVVFDVLDKRTGIRTHEQRLPLAPWHRATTLAKSPARFTRHTPDGSQVKCVDGSWRPYLNADADALDEGPHGPHNFCPNCGRQPAMPHRQTPYSAAENPPMGAAYAELRQYPKPSLRPCDECSVDEVMLDIKDFEDKSGLKFTSAAPRHVQLGVPCNDGRSRSRARYFISYVEPKHLQALSDRNT